MKRTILMSLLLSLNALPALAADQGLGEGIFGQALPMVAQLSPEERRALRDRWEQAAPDERAVMRREFKERLRQVPPEQREIRRNEFIQHWQNLPPQERERLRAQREERRGPPADLAPPDGGMRGFGFGRGYERRFENTDPDQGGRR